MFDLTLAATPLNPTTEPRLGPAQTILFSFAKPVNAATVTNHRRHCRRGRADVQRQ